MSYSNSVFSTSPSLNIDDVDERVLNALKLKNKRTACGGFEGLWQRRRYRSHQQCHLDVKIVEKGNSLTHIELT
jgi:hypothetical protein